MPTPTALAPLPSPARSISVEDFPPEVVHRIVRHLSSTPRAKYWTCNVPAATVRSLFLSSGPFPVAAAAIFDSVTTVNDPFPVDAPPTSRGAVVTVAELADHGRLASLLKSIGPSLVSLNILHSSLQPDSPASHSAWAVFAAHLSPLRELSLNVGIEPAMIAEDFGHPALLALLSARGGGLEAFTLFGAAVPVPIADAVARHCRALRRLRVEVAASDVHGLVPLLLGVGAGLRELELVAPAAFASLAVLKAAKDVCASLARLEMRFMYGGVGAQHLVSKIVDENGASLRTLALSEAMAQVPVLDGIVAAWPDIRFDVEVTGDAAPKVLAALDGRIIKLNLHRFDEASAGQELDCSCLETLKVLLPHERSPHCTAKVLLALAAKGGLPSLRHACIACSESAPVEETAAALAVLEAAGGLQSLHFSSAWGPVGTFEAVARANPGLADVCVRFVGLRDEELPQDYVEVLADVVTSFGKFCPAHASIKVEKRGYTMRQSFDVVANACTPLRTRCLSVSVMGVQYLL